MAVAAGGINVSTNIRPRRRTIDRNSQPTTSSISTPFSATAPTGPSFDSIPEDYANRNFKSKHQSSRARFLLGVRLPMFSDVAAGWQSHWLSRLRSALRLLVVVLSGAVIVFLGHTLEIRRGNRYLDLRKGELPMTWPARTNFYPTLILLLVALGNFVASVTSIALAFRRSFRRPSRSSTAYRVVGHCLVVFIWAGAITAFTLLDKHYKASLGRYACHNQNVMSNGRYQYRAVCEEQVRSNRAQMLVLLGPTS
ncbi:hypothetical protein DM02DRAFT_611260 [Periconia macrospinosa]|uniref:Uncharacterized protein n=1 Tax=Periconia macrospinosa TaxID=97972 RepID=A0A2V1E278_9PLEO|nr:hypothetical protein DM02DRAFT_611260 [Periconia macrospinosa]